MTLENENFVAAVEEMYKTPSLFCIVTWGASGSHWLSATLNDIPGVLCLHDGRFAARTILPNCGVAPDISDVDYLRVLSILGSGGKAAGDVHGVGRSSVPILKNAFGERVQFAVLVRNPLARLRSQFALFESLSEFERWNVEPVRELIENNDLVVPNRSYKTLLQVHGINMLNSIEEEVEIGPVFRLEDLSVSRSALNILVRKLTRNTVDIMSLEGFSHLPPTNRHSSRAGCPPVFERWHQAVLDRLVTPQSRSLYEEVGYTAESFVLPT